MTTYIEMISKIFSKMVLQCDCQSPIVLPALVYRGWAQHQMHAEDLQCRIEEVGCSQALGSAPLDAKPRNHGNWNQTTENNLWMKLTISLCCSLFDSSSIFLLRCYSILHGTLSEQPVWILTTMYLNMVLSMFSSIWSYLVLLNGLWHTWQQHYTLEAQVQPYFHQWIYSHSWTQCLLNTCLPILGLIRPLGSGANV